MESKGLMKCRSSLQRYHLISSLTWIPQLSLSNSSHFVHSLLLLRCLLLLVRGPIHLLHLSCFLLLGIPLAGLKDQDSNEGEGQDGIARRKYPQTVRPIKILASWISFLG